MCRRLGSSSPELHLELRRLRVVVQAVVHPIRSTSNETVTAGAAAAAGIRGCLEVEVTSYEEAVFDGGAHLRRLQVAREAFQ
jgi:hypothetical protein